MKSLWFESMILQSSKSEPYSELLYFLLCTSSTTILQSISKITLWYISISIHNVACWSHHVSRSVGVIIASIYLVIVATNCTLSSLMQAPMLTWLLVVNKVASMLHLRYSVGGVFHLFCFSCCCGFMTGLTGLWGRAHCHVLSKLWARHTTCSTTSYRSSQSFVLRFFHML
jgi:hypothetical protein